MKTIFLVEDDPVVVKVYGAKSSVKGFTSRWQKMVWRQ